MDNLQTTAIEKCLSIATSLEDPFAQTMEEMYGRKCVRVCDKHGSWDTYERYNKPCPKCREEAEEAVFGPFEKEFFELLDKYNVYITGVYDDGLVRVNIGGNDREYDLGPEEDSDVNI